MLVFCVVMCVFARKHFTNDGSPSLRTGLLLLLLEESDEGNTRNLLEQGKGIAGGGTLVRSAFIAYCSTITHLHLLPRASNKAGITQSLQINLLLAPFSAGISRNRVARMQFVLHANRHISNCSPSRAAMLHCGHTP